MDIIINFIVLIFAIIIHELSHGYVAGLFGDPTAKNAGRITLNPIPHIDIFGSILLPALFIITGSRFMIGWAKPVPVNQSYFKYPFRDMMWVSIAGPLSNITIAVFCSFLYKIFKIALVSNSIGVFLLYFLIISVQVNIVLAVFNLIPIPPLDGSRIILNFLPNNLKIKFMNFEPYGFVVIFLLAYLGLLGKLLGFFLPPLIDLLLM